MMADFISFAPVLKRYLNKLKPKNVLEWGPGLSTRIIVMLPGIQLVSLEHDLNYYTRAAAELKGFSNIDLQYKPLRQEYINYPSTLGKTFDLVFIDGLDEWRNDCLKAALSLISPGGVVILHDSERESYAEGKVLYTVLEESDGTAVLKPK